LKNTGANPECQGPTAGFRLIDPGHQRGLPIRLARQGFFQHLDDVARRQQRQARLMGNTLLSDEQQIATMTIVTWWCQACQPSA
jgi:hypothetical protein